MKFKLYRAKHFIYVIQVALQLGLHIFKKDYIKWNSHSATETT